MNVEDTIDALSEARDWLNEHWPDDLPEPYVMLFSDDVVRVVALASYGGELSRREQIALAAKVLADGPPLGSVEKVIESEVLFTVRRKITDRLQVEMLASRDEVCTRRQVGTKIETRPAPDAPTVEVQVPVYEWECEGVLS